MNIQVVTGDQADNKTLDSWVATTGGDFDVIIDDGGHTMPQIYWSFQVGHHKQRRAWLHAPAHMLPGACACAINRSPAARA
jgi:hypothetical protein